MPMKAWSVAAVGDVMIDRENPESSFSLIRDVIQKAEISFCQLETAYSDKGSQGSSGPRGAMRHDLRNYAAIPLHIFSWQSRCRRTKWVLSRLSGISVSGLSSRKYG